MRLNRPEQAAHWYRESLRSKPDHIPAHLTYGKLLSILVGPLRSVVREGTASKQLPVQSIYRVQCTPQLAGDTFAIKLEDATLRTVQLDCATGFLSSANSNYGRLLTNKLMTEQLFVPVTIQSIWFDLTPNGSLLTLHGGPLNAELKWIYLNLGGGGTMDDGQLAMSSFQ